MQEIVSLGFQPMITSLELRDIINKARDSAGGSKVRNDDFIKRIEDELEGELGAFGFYAHPRTGTTMKYYNLTTAQAVQILSRESGAARRLMSEAVEDHVKLLEAYREIDTDELEVDRFVYVAKNTKTGAYKVGISRDPEARIKQLQTGSDGDLVLIGCKQGTYQDETAAHKLHSGKRIRSEWFQLNDQDVKSLIC